MIPVFAHGRPELIYPTAHPQAYFRAGDEVVSNQPNTAMDVPIRVLEIRGAMIGDDKKVPDGRRRANA
jgi:hypothetical protein